MRKEQYLGSPLLLQQLPVFFQPWWLDIVSNDWQIALAPGPDGAPAGIWPVAREKKIGLAIARNPLLTPYLGPLFLQSLSEKEEAAVFEALWQQLPRWDSFDMETTVAFHQAALLQQKDFEVSEKITFEIGLAPEEDMLWRAMNSNHRNLIRQAESHHSVVEHTGSTERLLTLHRETFARKNKAYPFDPALIDRLVHTSREKNSGGLWYLQDEQGHTNATIFTVWDHQKMYLLLSAVDPEAAHPGAVRLLIWYAIKTARQKGLSAFDFEGSMDPGIAAFFRRFGGSQKTYLCASRNRSLLWKVKKTLLG
ncbi:GNAT family N-acetyltransferase [Taibaiella koreensis]|uniref:GNAT family N-acetyltransferase n=1 Tax=Taibaiella koreensis TaxID=1268548 RepID=UPI000E59C2A1|nr:GNAT family N-acetyltransferase [Taibaiella koreensis]